MVNFAQGEFVMLPAFMMLGFMSIGAPLAVSFTMTVVLAVFVLGWVFKRGLVDPLFKFGMMPIVVATIGLSIAMRNGLPLRSMGMSSDYETAVMLGATHVRVGTAMFGARG